MKLVQIKDILREGGGRERERGSYKLTEKWAEGIKFVTVGSEGGGGSGAAATAVESA